MNALNYAANQTPTAQPVEFDFDGLTWRLWPVDTYGIASALERWVCQFVRQQVEILCPHPDDPDQVAWRIYNEDKKKAQKDIQHGDYGALMPEWVYIVNMAGWKEAIFRCVSWKCQEWTRQHVERLLFDERRKQDFQMIWDELNYPKAKLRQGEPPPETSPIQSAGIESSSDS